MTVNGRILISEDYGVTNVGNSGSNRASFTLTDLHHLVVSAGLFTMSVDSSDRFVNIASVSVSD